jgi:hypothetical protein
MKEEKYEIELYELFEPHLVSGITVQNRWAMRRERRRYRLNSARSSPLFLL